MLYLSAQTAGTEYYILEGLRTAGIYLLFITQADEADHWCRCGQLVVRVFQTT